MRYSELGGSEAELDYAMGVAERGFAAEPPAAQFTTLCLMAVIVSRYPPGPCQEEAEDRLCGLLGQVSLTPEELAMLRRFRAQGLQVDARRARRRATAGTAPRRPR
ncbi:hypothetical protein QMO56_06770 [Roseomonas sp. E05]|uniref:hypothetical protein n=1 Tax=Roseomonas sp. E05 TaxID=3046310 RepID=UPI0024BA737F|nr:hypothetical protein [Roseomonas sp. E05]MDJ0387811.1 hypothetical protein [Roseomonas sp. E05]